MTPFKPGDVVAVEFPFTDFQTYKRRPGLVLAISETDLLVARLTTHPPRDAADLQCCTGLKPACRAHPPSA